MEENFGQKLLFWRQKLRLSQNELAKRAGVSPVTIGQIENSDRRPRRQTAEKLIAGLGITEVQLLGMTTEHPVETAPRAGAQKPAKEPEMARPTEENIPVLLSNLDLEIINRVLNLTFDAKLDVLKYIRALHR
jgi:transcriptional regulator with XRE-family HTH domain